MIFNPIFHYRNIIFFLLFINFNSFGQLKCEDFKTGTFYIENEKPDNNLKKWIIVRTENDQIEYENELGNNPMFLKIKWIDDCSFTLKLDVEKLKYGRKPIAIDPEQVLRVMNIRIDGKCMLYKTTILDENGQEFSRTNKFARNKTIHNIG
ncbi:hypothetical protein [Gillisia mitskevichiae]|nr:hypothetical protein [Gillisia mitskevichiae]